MDIVNSIIPELISEKKKYQLILPLFRGEDKFHLHITSNANISPIIERLEYLDSHDVEIYDGLRLTEVAVRGSVKEEKCILESTNNVCKIVKNFSEAHPKLFTSVLREKNVDVHNHNDVHTVNTQFSLMAIENCKPTFSEVNPLSNYANAPLSERDGFHAYSLIGKFDSNVLQTGLEGDKNDIKEYVKESNNLNPELTSEAKELIKEYYLEREIEWENPYGKSIDFEVVSKAYARLKQKEEVTSDMVREVCSFYSCEEVNFDVDMTETSQSISQEDRRSLLKQVIGDCEDEGEKGAPHETVMQVMTGAYVFDEKTIEHDLNKLTRDGKLYEPRKNEYGIMD